MLANPSPEGDGSCLRAIQESPYGVSQSICSKRSLKKCILARYELLVTELGG